MSVLGCKGKKIQPDTKENKENDYFEINMVYKFNIDPMGKPRMVRSDRWTDRDVVNRYWAFKDELNRQARKLGYKLGEKIRLTFLIPMPLSWSMKKRTLMQGKPHQQKPDVDNLCKSFLDSLTADDTKVWNISITKLWDVKGGITVENF